jgi:protein-export chaperone SecB
VAKSLHGSEAAMAKTIKPVKTAPRKVSGKSNNGSQMKVDTPAVAPVSLSAPEPQPGQQPIFKILGQYLKDFSFENPNAPLSLAQQAKQPDINISVNVNARNLGPNDFEVELHLEAKASSEGKVMFAADLLYAGMFKLENFPANLLQTSLSLRPSDIGRCHTKWGISTFDAGPD